MKFLLVVFAALQALTIKSFAQTCPELTGKYSCPAGSGKKSWLKVATVRSSSHEITAYQLTSSLGKMVQHPDGKIHFHAHLFGEDNVYWKGYCKDDSYITETSIPDKSAGAVLGSLKRNMKVMRLVSGKLVEDFSDSGKSSKVQVICDRSPW